MSDLPTIVTTAGLQPMSPAAIRAKILALALAEAPGITADLPGTLIEDHLSTSTAAAIVSDQARVELVNSLTPAGANEFLLQQIGTMIGVPIGGPTNTSVEVVFTAVDVNSIPVVGLIIPRGFLVGDGANQYALDDGGTTGTGGVTPSLSAHATQQGSFAVPGSTVTMLVTSPPPNVTLTVNNPQPGTPGLATETFTAYRPRVLQAELAASVGMPRYLKTLLGQVPGVEQRLIRAVSGSALGTWKLLVGGTGDNYAVADAIYRGFFDFTTLVGSTIDPTRNVAVNINDFPDQYVITFIQPPRETINVVVTWNSSGPNIVNTATVQQLGAPAVVNYINSIPVGMPFNGLDAINAFHTAIEGVLPLQFLTRVVLTVSINGVGVLPISGTYTYQGDPESYLLADSTSVQIVQG